jgi:hypothetical protein
VNINQFKTYKYLEKVPKGLEVIIGRGKHKGDLENKEDSENKQDSKQKEDS